MPSKLSRFSAGVMEAAWLAAVILVPVFFNIYSSRIFEPDKITLLRTLALIILGAWVIKLLEEGRASLGVVAEDGFSLRRFLRYPLVTPVLGLALVYLIATIFSVTPAVSLWGSYQRLQGTYTTLSYIVIFAAIAATVRTRLQVERLITAVIIASLPVALYGVLQRYQLDPVPWGGNTSRRIAANLGNSIFVAAYLIMVFPLTVGRIILSFRDILNDSSRLVAHVSRATLYVFIAALQLIALYMSGSRGPALGWMAGTAFMALLLTLYWRKRWLAFTMVGLALFAGAFLLVFNIENGPLESLRSSPYLGRFGQLLDSESNSALVRKYIWEGAADLVAPHDPLVYPDGSTDAFNFLRPLIGYGPESMYVAYNPFYPPALGTVERRNASPDRSHNETWDSLVITGALGLVAYLAMFTAVFYYGLKWLGLVIGRKRKILFFALLFGTGLTGAIGLAAWRGIEYAGLGLPFGLLLGLIAYIAIEAMFPDYEAPQTPGEALRALTMIVLLSAVVAHFIEINFGIAIAVTRTYFWVFSALLFVVGYVLPKIGEYDDLSVPEAAEVNASSSRSSSKKRRRRQASSNDGWPGWMREALAAGVLLAIVLGTVGFDYFTNTHGGRTATSVLWTSLTQLRGEETSYGLLALALTTWLGAGLVLASEIQSAFNLERWLKSLGLVLGSAGVLALFFWLWHAGNLANLATTSANSMDAVLEQVQRYEAILTRFYIYVILLIGAMSFFLVSDWPQRSANSALVAGLAAPAILALVLFASANTNLRVIQADIAFKMADPFTRSNSWPVAIEIYNHANELAPSEDYYYLFLGRAYIEHAKTLQSEAEQDAFVARAEQDLLKAQKINPLNTDHTANLARLYSLWASFTNDPELKQQRAEKSDEYFALATTLSPHNSRLWDERALLHLNIMKDNQRAYELLNHSLEIDPTYDWTHGMLGDYYMRTLGGVEDPEQRREQMQIAAEHYQKAIDLVKYYEAQNKFGYTVALGSVYVQLEEPAKAIAAYQQSLDLAPSNSERWRIEETLSRLYLQEGDVAQALSHAQNALTTAPDQQKQRIQDFIAQINGQQ